MRDSAAMGLGESNPASFVFEVFDELPSTNAHLMQYCRDQQAAVSSVNVAEAGEICLCATAVQTAGVGRRGKTWVSGPDCITFSLLQPLDMKPSEIGGLSLVTGLAVAEALQPLLKGALELKWPNDILAGSKKLCGVLIELPVLGTCGVRTVTGIGINFSPADTHRELDRPYTTLVDLAGQGGGRVAPAGFPAREELIGQVAASVVLAHRQFANEGWSYFQEAFNKRDCLKNQAVQIEQGSELINGVATGVNDEGALQVLVGGVEQTFMAGEVSIAR